LSQDKRPNGATTSWSYDAANNIKTVTTQAAIGGATTASCYDTNNTELTYLQANSSTCTNSPSQSFGYDGVGDRTSLTAGSSVTNYCFNLLVRQRDCEWRQLCQVFLHHRDREALCRGQMHKTHQVVRLGKVNAPFGQQGFQHLFDCFW
jgi:hypothetical protein